MVSCPRCGKNMRGRCCNYFVADTNDLYKKWYPTNQTMGLTFDDYLNWKNSRLQEDVYESTRRADETK